MTIGIILIIVGVVGLLTSRSLTLEAWKKAGLADAPREILEATQGTGIVPKHVSYINLTSWGILIIGIIISAISLGGK